jgi:hypothetical protein
MMIVSRQFLAPPLDAEPYTTVPLFNRRSTLLGLIISFTVTSFPHRLHVVPAKLTLPAGLLLDMLLAEAVYPLCHPPHARMG